MLGIVNKLVSIYLTETHSSFTLIRIKMFLKTGRVKPFKRFDVKTFC